MEILKKILVTFALIIAGITVSSTVFITVFIPEAELNVTILWEIIIMSAVCSLGDLLFYSKHELSKKSLRIRMIIHYIFINIIVIGGAYLWMWIAPGYFLQLIALLFLIAAVYAGIMLANLSIEKKTAEDLNKRLNRLNTEEDDKEQ